jgi:putative ABC transport system permease protein
MLVATIGGIGLSGTLSISVMEQTREIGVMRSIGASSRSLIQLFLAEGLIQAMISWFLAIPFALLAAEPLAKQMGQTILEVDLDFSFAWWAVIVWLLTIVIIAGVATIFPARQAAQISVRDSLSYA